MGTRAWFDQYKDAPLSFPEFEPIPLHVPVPENSKLPLREEKKSISNTIVIDLCDYDV